MGAGSMAGTPRGGYSQGVNGARLHSTSQGSANSSLSFRVRQKWAGRVLKTGSTV